MITNGTICFKGYEMGPNDNKNTRFGAKLKVTEAWYKMILKNGSHKNLCV